MIRTFIRPLLISPLIQQAARGLVQVLDTKSNLMHDVEDLPPLLVSKVNLPYTTGRVISQALCDKSDVKKASIIYFGEVHQNEEILKAQLSIMYHISQYRKNLSQPVQPRVHLVLEFFNFGQQKLLDQYTHAVREGIKMNDAEMKQKALDELEIEYQKSLEGFQLSHYSNLLDLATELEFDIHAGFINREIARMMLSKEKAEVLQAASQYMNNIHVYFEDSPEHLRHFMSLMTGEDNMTDQQLKEIPDRMRKLFQAQCLKDSSMADKIYQLATSDDSSSHNIVLAIAGRYTLQKYFLIGSNHFEYGLGVPERVNRLFANSNQNTFPVESVLITCKDSKDREALEKDTRRVSDYVYFVDFPEDETDTPPHFHATQSPQQQQ